MPHSDYLNVWTHCKSREAAERAQRKLAKANPGKEFTIHHSATDSLISERERARARHLACPYTVGIVDNLDRYESARIRGLNA